MFTVQQTRTELIIIYKNVVLQNTNNYDFRGWRKVLYEKPYDYHVIKRTKSRTKSAVHVARMEKIKKKKFSPII